MSRKTTSTLANDTLGDLIALVRDQQAQNTALITSMMAAHTAQTQVLQSWLDMFKPSATALPSTSPEDRDTLKKNAEMEAWEPMSLPKIEDILNG